MRKPALSNPDSSNQVHSTETERHVLHSNFRLLFCLKSGSTNGSRQIILVAALKAHQDENALRQYAFATSLYRVSLPNPLLLPYAPAQ